jgi:hypothetical protein
MKKTLFILFTFILGGFYLNATLTNDSVKKMVSAGLSDDTIIMAIQNEPTDFDVSVDALIKLKKADVSEDVIKAMMEVSGAEAPATVSNSDSSMSNGSMDGVIPPFIDPMPGNKYFTRFTFHYERGRYIATNYSRGTIVPINTEVELIAYEPEIMILNIQGAMIKVKNVRKYTNATIEEFASLMLSEVPTNIDAFGERMASDIANGQMRKGMTKEQVLMTRGYPPKHDTPSIDADRWIYWSSRFVKRTIVFYDDKLSEGRGIN